MKRTERYCDVCGTQMTYQDTDGNTCEQGITVSGDLRTSINCRTSSGESSSLRKLRHTDFCSYDCFERVVKKWMQEVQEASVNMEPLK
jgi:hypothetical protein